MEMKCTVFMLQFELDSTIFRNGLMRSQLVDRDVFVHSFRMFLSCAQLKTGSY